MWYINSHTTAQTNENGPARAAGPFFTAKGMKEPGMRKVKIWVESVVLYVLYGGLHELSKRDSRVRAETERWPNGFVYALTCGYGGPALYLEKTPHGLRRRRQTRADTSFDMKSVEKAFVILTGRQGLAMGYAAHSFSVRGEIATAMSFARCAELTEAYLFPRVLSRRLLREVPKKEFAAIRLYGRILVGSLSGRYRAKEETA